MSQEESKLNTAWWALRIVFGAVPLVAGLDKLFNLNILTTWEMYLSPLAVRLLPVSATTFMRAAGLVEMVAGLIVLSRYTRLGAYVVTVWLVAIALNLITARAFFDIAARDLGLAVGAFALARMTEFRQATYARRSGNLQDIKRAA